MMGVTTNPKHRLGIGLTDTGGAYFFDKCMWCGWDETCDVDIYYEQNVRGTRLATDTPE